MIYIAVLGLAMMGFASAAILVTGKLQALFVVWAFATGSLAMFVLAWYSTTEDRR